MESVAHHDDCAGHRGRMTRVMSIPLEPLRWLVLGCLGVAVLGMVAPFPVFPPCPLLTATGVPCPLCGMTRSVRSLVRLDPGASLRYQPFGILAAAVAVAILAMWALPRTRMVRTVRVPLMLIVALGLASWFWNIGFNPTF
jgi:hypothetical protein